MMDAYIKQVGQIVDSLAGQRIDDGHYGAFFRGVGFGQQRFRARYPGRPNRTRLTQQELADKMSGVLRNYSFARSFVIQEQTIGGGRGGGLPVQYVIQAPSFEQLKEVIPKFMDKAQANPAFQVVDLNLKFNKPELQINIDRERARVLGVSVIDIAQTLQLYFSGQRFGYFILEGKQYQVIGQANRTNRDEPLDLSSVNVKNSRGELISLDNVVRLSGEASPPQLYRYNRYVGRHRVGVPGPGRYPWPGHRGDGQHCPRDARRKLLDGPCRHVEGVQGEFGQFALCVPVCAGASST
jgi:multidrug efflux pump